MSRWVPWYAVDLRARVAELERSLAQIHEAIGEDPASDDDSLPDVIAQIVRESRERIDLLERELAEERSCHDCREYREKAEEPKP